MFTKWWEHHASQPASHADLHESVKEAIDPDARRVGEVLQYSRQKVTWFLRKHVNARAGGFYFVAEELPTRNEQGNAVVRYRLRRADQILAPL